MSKQASSQISKHTQQAEKQRKQNQGQDMNISNGKNMQFMLPNIVLSMAQQSEPTVSNEPFFSRSEKHYLSDMSPHSRDTIVSEFKKIEKKTEKPIRFRVIQSKLPNKNEILHRLKSCDSGKMISWVENALALPLEKYAPPPISKPDGMIDFVNDTRAMMDAEVFGQNEAKDEMMRLLCQWVSSVCLNTFAIGLEGPPGIGKTTFAKKVISKTMNRPFQFVSLGGASDACGLLGHSFTYEGAIPGKIAESLRHAKVMNPVFFF